MPTFDCVYLISNLKNKIVFISYDGKILRKYKNKKKFKIHEIGFKYSLSNLFKEVYGDVLKDLIYHYYPTPFKK